MKNYRIGELAEELGVTSSFIKNCERYGILETQVEPNGYRYYRFNQSANLIEYMKLQNQGYQAKEIAHFMKDSSLPELISDMSSHKEELEKQIRFQQLLLKYYEDAPRYLGMFQRNEWYILDRPAFYFLPHSDDALYSGRQTIRDVVKNWNEWFPIVRSTRTTPSLDALVTDFTWGLSVSDTFAREQGLLINNEVRLIHSCKCLIIFKRIVQEKGLRYLNNAEEIKGILKSINHEVTGSIYEHVYYKLQEGGSRVIYSIEEIPIRPVS